ncbi:MAG: ATP-dependent DNA ligase, partial [Acidimicrobiaceae bacterium]|nr:ATP-dependent DNA ligase [Acidimicrobiaceae bacterium]
MRLPVQPPVAPMLARSVSEVPVGHYAYEPKWDGFRCIVFRDGDEVELGSRNGRPLTRYFPEVVDAVRARLPERCVADGELVVTGPAGLEFDLLSQRIHPAASRVNLLAESTPAELVLWDLLALGDRDLREEPFSFRRGELERILAGGPPAGVHLTPLTREAAVAEDWFARFEGAGLDGVVAKDLDLRYLEDQRVMYKVKHERTAEFVVGGFRWYKADRTAVGSLMLGLYDDGALMHVGVIGAFPAAQRRALVEVLAPYVIETGSGVSEPAGEVDSAGGGESGGRGESGGGGGNWSASSPAGRRRACISRRSPGRSTSPRTGSPASKAPGWTASWPRTWIFVTS